ncbi:MAG: hypothetical protein PVH61_35360 [Candidatus Aminicenantes bacterium]|jgi:hypothetical protein
MNTQSARWDCPYCGREGLLESQTVCSACRAQRPAAVKFYYPEETGSETLTPQEKAKEKEAGGCAVFAWGFGLAFLLIIVVIFFPTIKKTALSIFNAVDSLFSKNMEAVVLDHRWERTADLYQKREVTEEGWEVPQGGTLIESYPAVHHKEKVHKGYRDGERTVKVKKADGKYEERTETYREEIIEEVPVYKEKYKYRIPRWVKIEQLKTSGQDKNPYWPTDYRLNIKEQYKIFDRGEKYFIIIEFPDGTTADAEASRRVWKDIVEGQNVKVVKHSLSGTYTIVQKENAQDQ